MRDSLTVFRVWKEQQGERFPPILMVQRYCEKEEDSNKDDTQDKFKPAREGEDNKAGNAGNTNDGDDNDDDDHDDNNTQTQ